MGKANSGNLEELSEKGAKRRRACLDRIDDDIVLLFIQGHDDAILGIAERDGEYMVVYDHAKIIQTLRKRDGMDKEGANEFFEYNIAGAMIASSAPLIIDRV